MVLFLYRLFFPLIFLFFLPGLIVKLIRRPGWKKTYAERFGIFSAARKAELANWTGGIWLHAVSVGETNLALTTLREWRKRVPPGTRFILSTTTTTGQEIARKQAPPDTCVIFCPIDFTTCVGRTLDLLHPRALVIFETELWPNLILMSRARGIRLALLNTRISDRSFRGYRRWRGFFAPLLESFELICAQTELDAERLETIAPARQGKVSVCGNIKFDQREPEGTPFDYSAVFGNGIGPVVIAASTHAPEESLIVSAWESCRAEFPQSRLVLVPRHAERGDELEKLLRARQLPYHRRSTGTEGGLTAGEKCAVLLADTTGELAKLIQGADLVLMGKTFGGNDEGQNIIEPAVMGKAVICGPRLRNFRQALDLLVRHNAVRRLTGDAELPGALAELLRDDTRRRGLGQRARETMLRNRGALEHTLQQLEKIQ